MKKFIVDNERDGIKECRCLNCKECFVFYEHQTVQFCQNCGCKFEGRHNKNNRNPTDHIIIPQRFSVYLYSEWMESWNKTPLKTVKREDVLRIIREHFQLDDEYTKARIEFGTQSITIEK